MAVTEKVEIMHFDQEGYLAGGAAAGAAGDVMEGFADRVAAEGYDAAGPGTSSCSSSTS